MKKFTAFCICAGLSLTLTGCALGDTLQQYIKTEEKSDYDDREPKTRVYMDEISGKLDSFTGSRLTLKNGDNIYTFDLTQATLECADGMIRGDDISVIYEGHLTNTDTSAVKALKVVDEFHKKEPLKERTATVTILGLSPNTITFRTEKNSTVVCPTTGAQQYYQNGIKIGSQVFLHFKGKFSKDSSDSTLNASHLKVLSISDIEPLKLPEPSPTPAPQEDPGEDRDKEKSFHAVIQNLSADQLTVLPSGSNTALTVNLSAVPVSFKGGAAPGSAVNIYYTGELQQDTLDGVSVTAVTGEDPDSIPLRNASSTVSGTIIGATANTVTIQTPDNAFVTCFVQNAQGAASCNLSEGNSVRITFHPSQSRDSNIYTAVKIENI